MKIGVCGGAHDAAVIKKYGYDFIEENFSSIAKLSDAQFETTLEAYSDIGLPVYSTNGFFPSGFVIYGAAAAALEYAKRGLYRAARLGVKVVVIGSGGQRRVLDGMDKNECEAEFARLVGGIADEAAKYGISVSVEPLKYAETNLINTVSDGVRIAKMTGRANVGTMVDFHHFSQNGEDGDEIIRAGRALIHAHIARPNDDRLIPTGDEDVPVVEKWAKLLGAARYKGRISLEGFFGDDYEHTLAAAKKILAPLAAEGENDEV